MLQLIYKSKQFTIAASKHATKNRKSFGTRQNTVVINFKDSLTWDQIIYGIYELVRRYSHNMKQSQQRIKVRELPKARLEMLDGKLQEVHAVKCKTKGRKEKVLPVLQVLLKVE